MNLKGQKERLVARTPQIESPQTFSWGPTRITLSDMKKSLALATALAVLTSFLPPPASAAVKKGAACTVKGQVKTAAGYSYTCAKSGNKLIWSKGVKISVKSAPATKSSSQGKTIPAAKAVTPLQKLNLDIYNRYLSADKKISPSFNFVLCPNVDSSMAAITQSAYIDAYSFWVPIYKATAKINWLLISEKDWNCWYDTTEKFEGPNAVSRSWNVWNKDKAVLGHCTVSSNAFCGYGTGVREGGVFAQYNMIGSNYKIPPTSLTVHHETVHNYQAQLIADNYLSSKTNTVACWFMEGQANLFGVPIAMQGNPETHRSFEIKRLLKVFPKGSSYSKEEWIEVFNKLKTDNDFCFNNELGYSLGWFALEWTYLNYSIEDMHTFLELIAKGSTWEQAIQDVMNMDEQAYYAKIANYFVEQF